MKSLTSIFKNAAASLVVLGATVLLTGSTVSAIPYTGATTPASPVPAFNVYTPTSGNTLPAPAPAAGEQDFFRGRVPVNGDLNEGATQYTDPLKTNCTDGQVLQLHIYVHNGASADGNNNGSGPSVAHNTQVKVALPTGQATNFKPSANISASNAATVNDDLTINCNGKSVKLQYVPGSASQYSAGSGVRGLSDAIVGAGVPIQSHDVAGDVWGCWNDRVYVVLAVKVVVPPTPPVASGVCTFLTVLASADRKVTVNTYKSTVSNSVFKNANIGWGDTASSSVTDESKMIGQTHQYKADGTYHITTTVNYTSSVDGSTITSAPATCSTDVTFKQDKPPVVTPPEVTPPTVTPPKTLVNTGPGSVMAIVAAVVAVSTFGYRFVLGRKLAN